MVLGAGCRLAEDVDEAACRRDHVPIVRRASGGGTILQGRGCLSYTLVLDYNRDPRLRDVRGSYHFILEQVRQALMGLLAGVQHVGISDLAAEGRKFSGNAQQRKRSFLLHHGTILHHFDINEIGRYLRVPHTQPAYRQERAHTDFLQNLPASAGELKGGCASLAGISELAGLARGNSSPARRGKVQPPRVDPAVLTL